MFGSDAISIFRQQVGNGFLPRRAKHRSPLPGKVAHRSPAGAFRRAVNGDIQIGFRVLDDNLGQAAQAKQDLAMRLSTPPRGPLMSDSRTLTRST